MREAQTTSKLLEYTATHDRGANRVFWQKTAEFIIGGDQKRLTEERVGHEITDWQSDVALTPRQEALVTDVSTAYMNHRIGQETLMLVLEDNLYSYPPDEE